MNCELKTRIRAILFDVDDTLFDGAAAQRAVLDLIVRWLPHVFRGIGHDRALAAFMESDRITTEEFYTRLPKEGTERLREARSELFLRLLGLPPDSAGEITRLYVTECPAMNTPIPGALPLVHKLSRRFKIGAVSNGLPDVQYRKLEAIGVRPVLSCVVLSEEIGIRKPDPRIFHLAAARLGVPPEECLHVGDSYASDVAGAKGAGMLACWLNCEGATPDDESVRADYVVSHLEQVGEILSPGSGLSSGF